MIDRSQDPAQKAPQDQSKRAKPKASLTRYKKGRRVKQFCEDTSLSRPTVWRWAKAGTLLIEYANETPFVVGGPACLDLSS
jgi:hypothetical protein